MSRDYPWWFWVLVVDAILLLITVFSQDILSFPLGWRLDTAFNLTYEMNLAVWWSGGLLFCVGFLAYQLAGQTGKTTKYKTAWFIMAAILTGLSFDEVGSVHERLGDWSAIIPFILVGGMFFTYSIIVLYMDFEAKRSAVLLFMGFCLFGLVAIQEQLEHVIVWPEQMMGVRAGMEEGTELMAFLLIAFSIVRLRPNACISQDRQGIFIPHPAGVFGLMPTLIIGLIAHGFISFYVVPGLDDLEFRGNPGVWYPTYVYLLTAAAAYWRIRSREPHDKLRVTFMMLAGFTLLCSIGALYSAAKPWAVVGEVFPLSLQTNFVVWHLIKTGVFALFCLAIPEYLSSKNLTLFLFLTFLLPGVTFTGNAGGEFLVSGVLAFCCAIIFICNPFKAEKHLGKKVAMAQVP